MWQLWNVNYLHDEDGEDDVIKTNEATSSEGVSVGTSSQSKDPPEAINSDDESDEDMEAEGKLRCFTCGCWQFTVRVFP